MIKDVSFGFDTILYNSEFASLKQDASLKMLKSSNRKCSIKKMFLKILQNSQKKHLHWSLFIIKLQGSGPIKKRFQHRCFPVDFAKFLEHIVYRTPPSGCTWMQCHWGFYPEPNQIRISRGQLLLTTTFKAF